MGIDDVKKFVEALVAYLLSKTNIRTYKGSTSLDQILWSQNGIKLFSDIINEERELYFRLRIRDVLDDGYRLVGIGNGHRKNMMPFLKAFQYNIDHFFIQDWLIASKHKNKSIADTAIIRIQDEPYASLDLRRSETKREGFREG